MRNCFTFLSLIALMLALLSSSAIPAQNPKEAITDAEKAGPDFLVQGEYEGAIGKDKLAAQVIAKGNGKFTGSFLPG